MRTTIICNPYSGGLRGRGMRRLERAREILSRAGHELTVRPTTGPATAGDIARQSLAAGAELILAAGGDGTVHEIVNGMTPSPVPLGVLPAGTANVFAVETGLGTDLCAAAARLSECAPRRVALGRIECAPEARHFLLMAGAGFDAYIVHHASSRLKTRLGKASYWAAGFSQAVRRLEQLDITLDGRTRRCSFALISRVRNYGGDFEIARHASLLDDRFEVVLFEGRWAIRYLKYLAGMITRRLEGMKGVTFLHATRVELTAPGTVYLQTDGESAGALPARVTIVPDAITLLLPRPARHPL